MKLRLFAAALFLIGVVCLWQHADAQLTMSNVGEGGAGGAAGPFVPHGIQFNGSTDLQKSGGFSGSASAPQGTLSFWYQPTGADGTTRGLIQSATGGGNCNFQLVQLSSNVLRLAMGNTSTTLVSNESGSTTFLTGDPWRWVGMSWNFTTPVLQMYVNGVADTQSGGGITTGNMDFSNTCNTAWAIGSLFSALFMTSNIAEVYLDDTTFQNFTVTANVQKFYNSGNAVNMGGSCQLVTGSTPIMCMTGTLGSPWNNNKGTGGGFTVANGSLSNAATNPP